MKAIILLMLMTNAHGKLGEQFSPDKVVETDNIQRDMHEYYTSGRAVKEIQETCKELKLDERKCNDLIKILIPFEYQEHK